MGLTCKDQGSNIVNLTGILGFPPETFVRSTLKSFSMSSKTVLPLTTSTRHNPKKKREAHCLVSAKETESMEN